MRELREKGQITTCHDSLEAKMLRSFINHATRWMTIGVLAIFAIGSSARIAAACEGGGEEKTAGSSVEKEESLTDDMLNENPFDVEAEVFNGPIPEDGKGKVTNVGSCKIGNKVKAHSKCTFEQERPVGAVVTWRTV
jgi:hypothetical protein